MKQVPSATFGALVCMWTPAHVLQIGGTVSELENKYLRRLISQSHHTIDVRAAEITDTIVVRALIKAASRKVLVRLLLNEVPRSGQPLALVSGPSIQLRILPKEHHARFYSKDGKSSYAIIDEDKAWFGVMKWSPRSWRSISMMVIDQQGRGRFAEKAIYQRGWKTGIPVSDIHK